ncbi:MAG: 2-phosphosulfolactate phosphatase [Bacteroidales bacterium]|nr:2-phosphosulfolactate phosphatase [Bacteroidales bacterium]MBN2697233.1 2-phosphosulfolactate phosphatase [Bacteroidales bacterium]
MKKVEVCYSPALYPYYENREAVVVVTDVLRASSAIVTAFMNGVRKIIPVGSLEEAKAYKAKGFMVAAERDGIVRDFADFGNSPFNFTRKQIAGREIVYSTTNGTRAIHLASSGEQVLIGAYLNLTALVQYVINSDRDLLILCAGWKNKFNLEDTLFAGALAGKILENNNYQTICDATLGAVDLFELARNDMMNYMEKVAQRHRLKKNNLDDVIAYCHTPDLTDIIPVLEKNYLVAVKK